VTHPAILAHHYTEAGCHAQAIPYWQRAGQQARARASFVEATRLLSKALTLSEALPATPARAQQELDILVALGNALRPSKGLAAPEVEVIYLIGHVSCASMCRTPCSSCLC
jgi:predicted ATPase